MGGGGMGGADVPNERAARAKMSAWTKGDETKLLDAIETTLKGHWGTIATSIGEHRQAQGCVVHWGSLRRRLGLESKVEGGVGAAVEEEAEDIESDGESDGDWKGRAKGRKGRKRAR